MNIEVVGVYPVEAPEPCHLIELVVGQHEGAVNIGGFTQEFPGQPQSNWQAPWDERLLNTDGTQDIGGQFPRGIVAQGAPLRLAFFLHCVDFTKPLLTPAGEVALKSPELRPDRLAFLVYESPC